MLADGTRLSCRAVVVTTGTFLRALMHTGERRTEGGRVGEGLAIPELPGTYEDWTDDRRRHLERDLAYSEFTAALRLLAGDARLRSALGAAGKAYVSREYDWDVVEDRTSGFLASIAPVTEEAR